MSRLLIGTGARLAGAFLDQHGEPRAAAVGATARVLRGDGSTLVAAGTAAVATEGGGVAVDLAAGDNGRLDELTATWSEPGGASSVSRHLVVGAFFFSAAEARDAESRLKDDGEYTPEDVVRVRSLVEDEAELICGRAFVPRWARLALGAVDTARSRGVRLVPHVRAVRSFRVLEADGSVAYELSPAELAALDVDPLTGRVGGPSGRPGLSVDAEIEHGLDAPPDEVRRAAIRRLRAKLRTGKGTHPDRATSIQLANGVSYRLDMPGAFKTGDPEVDAVYARHSLRPPGGIG